MADRRDMSRDRNWERIFFAVCMELGSTAGGIRMGVKDSSYTKKNERPDLCSAWYRTGSPLKNVVVDILPVFTFT